jgi:hypothetical protein
VSKRILGILGVTIAVLLAGMAASQAAHTHAQTPTTTTVPASGAVIYTDKQQYVVGENVTVCVTIPAPGTINITELLPNGTSRVIYSGQAQSTQGCQFGQVGPGTGTHCLRLNYSGTTTLETQTCYTVVDPSAPPPPAGAGLFIITNSTYYYIGAPLTMCYTVPGPGNVTIVDTLANGQSTVFYTNFDDGSGACLKGIVTGPLGLECLTLNWTPVAVVPGGVVYGVPAQTKTCFQVVA